jgi:proteasome alpha subunit
MTPYDWQESIGQRAAYVENRLTGGLPLAAISLPEGILIGALRRQSQKVYEVYDRLAMSALGVQADVEALRVGAIEFCHREGYQRSVEDVTLKRLVSGLSASIKQSFADLRQSPFVVRALFCELGGDSEHDRFVVLDFDGDYAEHRAAAAVAGTPHASSVLVEKVRAISGPPDQALTALESVLRSSGDFDESVYESALLARAELRDRRMTWLTGKAD